MTRGKQDKLYRSFNKGLITEAGFLTYPEDASIDELNTVIYRKGNRTRRFGIDYEPSSTAITFDGGLTDTDITTEYFWRTPGNKNSLDFLVVQVGNFLYFFDTSVTPLSAGKKAFSINLNTFTAPAATSAQIRGTRVQMAGGKGNLFVAQEYIEPFFVSYDPVAGTITTIKVVLQMRDYDGVDDSMANDSEPATLTSTHHYNLMNQGWVTPGTSTTPTGGGSSPGTSQEYYNPRTGNHYDPRFPIP